MTASRVPAPPARRDNLVHIDTTQPIPRVPTAPTRSDSRDHVTEASSCTIPMELAMELTGAMPEDYRTIDPNASIYDKIPLGAIRQMVEERIEREVVIIAKALDALHTRRLAPPLGGQL